MFAAHRMDRRIVPTRAPNYPTDPNSAARCQTGVLRLVPRLGLFRLTYSSARVHRGAYPPQGHT